MWKCHDCGRMVDAIVRQVPLRYDAPTFNLCAQCYDTSAQWLETVRHALVFYNGQARKTVWRRVIDRDKGSRK